MNRLDAMRALLAAPHDHADQDRIGQIQKWDRPDGREKQMYIVRVLKSVLRRVA